MSERTRRKYCVFTGLAVDLGRLSTCTRLQVGCVIFPLDFSEVSAIGYNGPACGLNHAECNPANDPCGCAHAENNALLHLREPMCVGRLLVLHVTVPPCVRCAAAIVNSRRIGLVTFDGSHRLEGVNLLRRAGIRAVPMDMAMASFLEGGTGWVRR